MPIAIISPSLSVHYLEDNPSGARKVLLLHGLGANSESWRFQMPVLAEKGFHVIAPDVPGFGQSPPAKNMQVSVAEFAHIIAQFLKKLEIHRTHVIGISMGGTIALQLVLDYPQVVDKLILVNTFASLGLNSPLLLPYFLLRFILVYTLGIPAQANIVAKKLFPHPDQEILRQELIRQILQSNPRTYRAAMRALARFDATHRLSEINTPTLVVSGAEDTTVPLEKQTQLAEGIPNATHVVIPEAGHAITVEKAEAFNRHMLDFLL